MNYFLLQSFSKYIDLLCHSFRESLHFTSTHFTNCSSTTIAFFERSLKFVPKFCWSSVHFLIEKTLYMLVLIYIMIFIKQISDIYNPSLLVNIEISPCSYNPGSQPIVNERNLRCLLPGETRNPLHRSNIKLYSLEKQWNCRNYERKTILSKISSRVPSISFASDETSEKN